MAVRDSVHFLMSIGKQDVLLARDNCLTTPIGTLYLCSLDSLTSLDNKIAV